ncbi:hypothetical protein MATL_G00243070 [Megalops atlanticus]|uniref:Uncharacterized protein n=1 Tax=Megalops atlanticus TaxID=7932 RepID=A0A9D3PH09_MEGAT|nr:hypothetical protein MATL_G00243070 [Megalops atlanticus]
MGSGAKVPRRQKKKKRGTRSDGVVAALLSELGVAAASFLPSTALLLRRCCLQEPADRPTHRQTDRQRDYLEKSVKSGREDIFKDPAETTRQV